MATEKAVSASDRRGIAAIHRRGIRAEILYHISPEQSEADPRF